MHKTITHINFAKAYRGGERQTQLLIEELSKHAYLQKLLVRKNSQLGERCCNIPNLEVVEISKPYILSLKKIKNSVLLHAHETKAAQFTYFANLFYNIPYIVTRRVAHPIKNNFFTKRIYKTATMVVALSRAIKTEIEKIIQTNKITIIPSATTNFSTNKTLNKALQHRFAEKFIIGNIGELEPNKGQEYLIKAVKELLADYPHLHVVFLGKGVAQESLKLLTEPYEKNFSFEGFVNNVDDYLNLFDLFVFPTLQEGLGSILLDVMNAEVPIIASQTGGIPDIITHEETGLLFEPKNVQEIKASIELLLNNSTLAKQLTKNAKDSIHNYSPENMGKQYMKLYKEVIYEN